VISRAHESRVRLQFHFTLSPLAGMSRTGPWR
jgi:hypothetical protein